MVNAYLIRYDEGFIMIDAGNDQEIVKQELEKLDIKEDEITVVFLTHSDNDHVASISLFSNATIYLNKEELPMINGSKPRLLIQYNKIETDQYNLFVDGQSFKFQDITIRCIHTPGHTPGATCYSVNDQYLFTGDALSLHDGKVDEFIKLATMDLETHRNSIDKIGSIPNIKYIFTAHHGMTDDFDYAFSDWKENQ
jgi:glyoxylase-like metal-dependent hydrolase (beta-lactamase superfamily II)